VELLFITGERTALYPQTKKRIELLDKDILDRIQKWRMFSAIWELEIDDYYSKKISYKGIKYGGSTEQVFWHYFPPFFKYEMPKVLSEVEAICIEKNLPPKEYVEEAADLLKVMVSRLWKEIAETHQKLKGEGFPKPEDLPDVSGTIASFKKAIDEEVKAVLLMEPKTAPEVKSSEDIIDVKPNFMGLGVNLNAAFRWCKSKWKGM
tara:strand:+ start:565 stop:1182 length:618 start_codon:yes stop_codon:yes gene_type:complete